MLSERQSRLFTVDARNTINGLRDALFMVTSVSRRRTQNSHKCTVEKGSLHNHLCIYRDAVQSKGVHVAR